MPDQTFYHQSIWTGRIDQEGKDPLSQYWHQQVKPFYAHKGEPGLAIIGLASDEGAIRSQRRQGTEDGPDVIRKALCNLPWNRNDQAYDMGNITCSNKNLDKAQAEYSEAVSRALNNRMLPLGLGGGQEITWAGYQGLVNHLSLDRKSSKNINIGVINFDSCFDLQKPDRGPSSTTVFRQIHDHSQQHQTPFHYLNLGVSRTSNTRAQFELADKLDVAWLTDDQINDNNYEFLIEELECFTGMVDHVYLSIDLSVFSGCQAPGVSEPSVRGIPLEVAETLLRVIKGSEKLRVIDIAEYNPKYDHDSRTARLAAWIIHLLTSQEQLMT